MLRPGEFTVSQCRNSNTSVTSSVIQCLRAGEHFVFQFIAIEGQMISPETSTKGVTKFCATSSSNMEYSTARVFNPWPTCDHICKQYIFKYHHHHHHHLPPWIRSFDLFRHRRIAIVSWGVRDPFFLEVCSSGPQKLYNSLERK